MFKKNQKEFFKTASSNYVLLRDAGESSAGLETP
jgi:hypothetical protein